MFDFEYYTPTKVLFGKDAEIRTGELVKEFGGTRVLIHYGGNSAMRSGLLDRIKASLDASGIFHVELGGVVPNPHLSKVREGIAVAKENNVDFFLAVGGGSVIDSTKAIAYAMAEPDHDVWELFQQIREAKACMPVASVLTIAAAGSEMSPSCVITNEQTGEKRSYNDDLSRPKFAIMNPALLECPSTCVSWALHRPTNRSSKCPNRVLLRRAVTRALPKYYISVTLPPSIVWHAKASTVSAYSS